MTNNVIPFPAVENFDIVGQVIEDQIFNALLMRDVALFIQDSLNMDVITARCNNVGNKLTLTIEINTSF